MWCSAGNQLTVSSVSRPLNNKQRPPTLHWPDIKQILSSTKSKPGNVHELNTELVQKTKIAQPKGFFFGILCPSQIRSNCNHKQTRAGNILKDVKWRRRGVGGCNWRVEQQQQLWSRCAPPYLWWKCSSSSRSLSGGHCPPSYLVSCRMLHRLGAYSRWLVVNQYIVQIY